MASKRIQKELSSFSSQQPGGCSVWPLKDDMFHLQGTIIGPEGTPFEGGKFGIEISLPSDYPFKPPRKVHFTTPIWHSHFPDGRVLMPGSGWEPKEQIVNIFAYIRRAMIDQRGEPLFADRLRVDNHDQRCSSTGELELAVKYFGGQTFTFRAAETDLVESIKGECHDRCCIGPTWMSGTQLLCGRIRLENGRQLSDYPDVIAKLKEGLSLDLFASLSSAFLPEYTDAGKQLAADEAGYLEKARLWTQKYAFCKVITVHGRPHDSETEEIVCTSMDGVEVRFPEHELSNEPLGTFRQRLAVHFGVPAQQFELVFPDGTLAGGHETSEFSLMFLLAPHAAADQTRFDSKSLD